MRWKQFKKFENSSYILEISRRNSSHRNTTTKLDLYSLLCKVRMIFFRLWKTISHFLINSQRYFFFFYSVVKTIQYLPLGLMVTNLNRFSMVEKWREEITFSGCVKNFIGRTGSFGESALHKALLLFITHRATSHTV